MPRAAAKPQNSKADRPPAVHVRLPDAYADEVARRLDRLEDVIECDRPFTLDDWERFVLSLCPERYADHPQDYRTRAEPGTPLKLEVIRSRQEQQLSIWHAMDPRDQDRHEELLLTIFATKEQRKEWRRLKAARRDPKPERKPKPRVLPHYHQGMLRFERCVEFVVEVERVLGVHAGREYDPSEWKRKGAATADGEANARRRKCHAG
jgi:hypothetical protein